MLHHGELLRNHNCPADYKEQLRAIVQTLTEHKIYHNDVHKNNVVVDAAGIITLIDFGWGSWTNPGFPYWNLSLAAIDAASSVEDLYRTLKKRNIP